MAHEQRSLIILGDNPDRLGDYPDRPRGYSDHDSFYPEPHGYYLTAVVRKERYFGPFAFLNHRDKNLKKMLDGQMFHGQMSPRQLTTHADGLTIQPSKFC